ncbi:AAA family ATPase [Nocardia sp. AG03]|uniref:AAA family ATPase n=1 Tax=Nocardia sp. AG03 TaxID=3025312 RepID=UPI0024186111|nr:AAA family ATPase [Nocardia sp. AG03]
MQIPAVGRQTEIARLRAAVLATAAGASRVVLLRGPAGIGKTWLAERAAELAVAAGLRVARGAAIDTAGMPPLLPWRQVARAVPGMDDALRTITEPGKTVAARRFRMCVEVAAALRAATEDAGSAVILEDLHWADSCSLELLTHLVTTSPSDNVLFVGTTREPAGNALLAELPEWLSLPHVECLSLSAFSESEVGGWLEQCGYRAGLSARVHARTGGDPLLLGLVTTSLEDRSRLDGPGLSDARPARDITVRDLVLARRQRLTPTDSALLSAASVLGERIDAEILAHLTAIPTTRVQRMITAAIEAGLVREFEDGTAGFRHALVRDAVYAALTAAHRAALHRRAAETLAERGGPDTELAGVIATHWHACGTLTPVALAWFRRAAHAARAMAAATTAIRFGEWALEAAATADEATRASLLIELARDEFDAGWTATSLDHSVAAATLAEQAARPDLFAEAALVVHDVTTPTVLTQLDHLRATALRHLNPHHHPDLVARLRARHEPLRPHPTDEPDRARDHSTATEALAHALAEIAADEPGAAVRPPRPRMDFG